MSNTASAPKNNKPKGKVSFKGGDSSNSGNNKTQQDAAWGGIAGAAAAAATSRFADANYLTGNKPTTYGSCEYVGSSYSPTWTRRSQLERQLGSRGVLTGIKNIGATCYAASLLQTIFMTPEMREHIVTFPFEEKQRHKNNIAYQLQLMFTQMQSRRRPYVDPTNLLLSFNMGPGAHTQQHDVQELNRQLLDVVQGFIDRTPSSRQVISELYRGTTADVKKCRGCGLERRQGGNVFLDLQVPFAGIAATLEEALAAYVKPDEIEGYKCDGCVAEKGPQTLEMGRVFECFPQMLSVHLMRFDFNYETMRREKKLDDLALPLVIDPARFISKDLLGAPKSGEDDDGSATSTAAPSAEPLDLYAMICHRGTPFSGHYYCFVRVADTDEELRALCPSGKQGDPEETKAADGSKKPSEKPADIVQAEAEAKRLVGGNWIKFDDDRVTWAEADEVLQYMDPALWKARKEALRAKRLAEEEARRAAEKKDAPAAPLLLIMPPPADAAAPTLSTADNAGSSNSNNNVATVKPEAATTATTADGYVTDHPLALPTTATTTTATDSSTPSKKGAEAKKTGNDTKSGGGERNADGLTKQDEEDIANLFGDAFGSMTAIAGSGAASSATTFAGDYSSKISGHSYYPLYRRRDLPPVRATDVFGHPPLERVPEYAKAQSAAAEKELADWDAELQQLLPVVSVGVFYKGKRTWIDVREGTTVAQLTELAYNQCVVEPNSRALVAVPQPLPEPHDNKTAAAASSAATGAGDDADGAASAMMGTQQDSLDNKEIAASVTKERAQNAAAADDSNSSASSAPATAATTTTTPIMDNRADANVVAQRQQSPPPPPADFTPAIARLRKYSTFYSVGGATFSGDETMLALGNKAASSSHPLFLLETRSEAEAAASNGAWRPATDLDFAFRIARLTSETPANKPITDFERVVVPAKCTLAELYAACAEKLGVAGGADAVQLTLRKDGEAFPLSIWEPRQFTAGVPALSSSVMTYPPTAASTATATATAAAAGESEMKAARSSSDAGNIMCSIFDTAGADGAIKAADVEMTDFSKSKNKDANNNTSEDAATKTAAEAAAEAADEKPYYRDLHFVTIDVAGLRQDDQIFVEALGRDQLPADAEQLRQQLVAVQFVDFQHMIKVFWSVSTGVEIPAALNATEHMIYVDRRKTLAHLKQKLCDMLGSVDVNDCQLLLDGAVRETKNMNQTIRAAIYGMTTLNAEIRKGRPLQDSESFVTVYRAQDDLLNPVVELKRLLIKSDTSIAALAAAALDPNVKNESSVPASYEDPSIAAAASAAKNKHKNGEETAADSTTSGDAAPVQQQQQPMATAAAERGVDVVTEERSQSQPGGGATRVTSVCVNGQHYRPRLMPPGTNVRAWGAPMYKREVKNNLTPQHIGELSEARVVLQAVPHEEALTKAALLLRMHRWKATAEKVADALGPAHHVVLQKDAPLETILDVISACDPELHPDSVEFTRCRAYQMRAQEAIATDLMWLSKSFLEMESGKRRTLCGHPMKFESDEIVLFRDADEDWPAGISAPHYGFDAIQSNSDAKRQAAKIKGGDADADADDDGAATGPDGKKKPGSKAKKSSGPAERGITLRMVWDDDDEAAATAASQDDAAAAAKKKQDGDNKKDGADDDADEVNSTGANDGDDEDAKLARALQVAEEGGNSGGATTKSSVAAMYGCAPEELINFVPCEPYSALHRVSLPPSCCVCFCEFEDNEEVCVTKCHHIVHKECLAPWLPQSFTCPQCKASLSM